MSKTNRRELLTLGLGGALGLAFLPMFRRVARAAAPGPAAKADRVLILNLTGGIRSSSAFHASPQVPYNPYGLMTGVSAPYALGAILDDGGDDASYTLGSAWGNARVAKLREITNQMSVLGTYSTSRGDHLRARIEEPTGTASGGAAGILTRIAAGLTESLPDSQPGFHISPNALFGNGGALTKYVPVSLANFASVPSASNTLPQWVSGTGNDYTVDADMRDRFDQKVIAARAGVGKLTTETLSFHRRAARDIGARLSQNDFAFAGAAQDAAALGSVQLAGSQPLTNGMLKELFRKGVPPQYDTFAVNLALAVRLLQIGSPCVTLETPNFDFHSGERTAGPPLYGYLGRAWAALQWLLSRIPSGAGSLLDRTLVITMSDFGRDKAQANGWNAGDGSDHGADFACFYLAHAVMGAGITPNRLVGSIDTNTYNGGGSTQYTPQQLLVTLLDSLGLDHENEQWGLPTGGDPIAELWS
jgi:hypothetical protein